MLVLTEATRLAKDYRVNTRFPAYLTYTINGNDHRIRFTSAKRLLKDFVSQAYALGFRDLEHQKSGDGIWWVTTRRPSGPRKYERLTEHGESPFFAGTSATSNPIDVWVYDGGSINPAGVFHTIFDLSRRLGLNVRISFTEAENYTRPLSSVSGRMEVAHGIRGYEGLLV